MIGYLEGKQSGENMANMDRDDLILMPDGNSLVERPKRSYAFDFPATSSHLFRVSTAQADALHLAFGNSARRPTSRSRVPAHPNLLPWGLYRPGVHHTQCDNFDVQLWVRDTGQGWLIDRSSADDPSREYTLGFLLGRFPLLVPNAYTAKLLAQACYPYPPARLETICWL